MWDENCWVLLNQIRIPPVCQQFNEHLRRFFKFLVVMFLFDSQEIGLRVIFHQFSKNFPTTLEEFLTILQLKSYQPIIRSIQKIFGS